MNELYIAPIILLIGLIPLLIALIFVKFNPGSERERGVKRTYNERRRY
jgi:hypothetical protein